MSEPGECDTDIYDLYPDVCPHCVDSFGAGAVHHDDMEHQMGEHEIDDPKRGTIKICEDCFEEWKLNQKQLTDHEKHGVCKGENVCFACQDGG
jgi:hypothetical protein